MGVVRAKNMPYYPIWADIDPDNAGLAPIWAQTIPRVDGPSHPVRQGSAGLPRVCDRIRTVRVA
mgnify:CR=1 FL=1